jgi:hypothetical protein
MLRDTQHFVLTNSQHNVLVERLDTVWMTADRQQQSRSFFSVPPISYERVVHLAVCLIRDKLHITQIF